MEENNDIFLAGGDAPVYLAEPVHKKYSTKFAWSCPVSTYVSYDQFFNSRPPMRTCTHIEWLPPPFPQFRRYLMDGLFLNQRTNNNIRTSYLLEYKHSKKKILEEPYMSKDISLDLIHVISH